MLKELVDKFPYDKDAFEQTDFLYDNIHGIDDIFKVIKEFNALKNPSHSEVLVTAVVGGDLPNYLMCNTKNISVENTKAYMQAVSSIIPHLGKEYKNDIISSMKWLQQRCPEMRRQLFEFSANNFYDTNCMALFDQCSNLLAHSPEAINDVYALFQKRPVFEDETARKIESMNMATMFCDILSSNQRACPQAAFLLAVLEDRIFEEEKKRIKDQFARLQRYDKFSTREDEIVDFILSTPADTKMKNVLPAKIKSILANEIQSDKLPENTELVFMGKTKPTADAFEKISNNGPIPSKPAGGLWTSPISGDNKCEWQVFLERGGSFPDEMKAKYPEKWHIIPDDDCKTLVVGSTPDKIQKYIDEFGRINYEKMALDYDAIYTPPAYGTPPFNGWDIATCLFLKPKFKAMDDKEYSNYKSKRCFSALKKDRDYTG